MVEYSNYQETFLGEVSCSDLLGWPKPSLMTATVFGCIYRDCIKALVIVVGYRAWHWTSILSVHILLFCKF